MEKTSHYFSADDANYLARAEAAARCGADLVFELPLPWALSSAEGLSLIHILIFTMQKKPPISPSVMKAKLPD